MGNTFECYDSVQGAGVIETRHNLKHNIEEVSERRPESNNQLYIHSCVYNVLLSTVKLRKNIVTIVLELLTSHEWAKEARKLLTE